MYVYLLYLLFFFGLPVVIIGWLLRREISRYKRTVLWCWIFVFTIGWFWDWLSVRTGVWRYDRAETLGLWLDGVPVEEWFGFYLLGTLFIVSVIFAVLRLFDKASITR